MICSSLLLVVRMLLVAMPGAPSSFLILTVVVMASNLIAMASTGPSSFLYPRVYPLFLAL